LNRKQEKRFWSADQKRFVYSLKEPAFAGSFLQSAGLPVGDLEGVWQI